MTVKAKPKHHLLISLLLAVFVAVGLLLAVGPQAQAQGSPNEQCETFFGFLELCIDKTVSPNPATVNEPITFTLTASCEGEGPIDCLGVAIIEDTLPAGVTFVSATASGGIFQAPACAPPAGQTVTCTGGINEENPITVIIEAIPTQCGDFTNPASVTLFGVLRANTSAPFTVSCGGGAGGGGAGGGGAGGGGGGGGQQGGGGGVEITQETEQEAESGDIDQSFDVSQTGDNSNQCAGAQGTANTGNPQNVTDLLQYASEVDDFEFEEVGSDITVSPESPTTCDQQGNQAASASG